MAINDPYGTRLWSGQGRPDPNSRNTWGGLGASPISSYEPSGRISSTTRTEAIRNPYANVTRHDAQPTVSPQNPGFIPTAINQSQNAGGQSGTSPGLTGTNANGNQQVTGGASGAGTGNGGGQAPFIPGGMSANPASVQQWKPASASTPWFTTAPDGPLAPEFANMQANVAAGVQQAQNTRPSNYSLATQNANVWLDPNTGGTWLAPGTGSYNSWDAFGTDRGNPQSPYSLPSGRYRPDPITGRLTQL